MGNKYSRNSIMASKKKHVELYVHGKKRTFVAKDHPHTMSLADYLRDVLNLTGTKVMCREGGCGACLVTVTFTHPVTKQETSLAVNSCLVSIYSCSNWKIATVEGMYSSGYNNIQNAMVENNATQCGYCTSGMIMNMFALERSKGKKITKEDIENSFGGNMCRCTGYRAIIDAYRSLVSAEEDFDVFDIEDAVECGFKCKSDQEAGCAKACKFGEREDKAVVYEAGDEEVKWYKVFQLSELKEIYKMYPLKHVRLVGGNTAQGVYRDMAEGDVCIDINSVVELKSHVLNNNELILGGNVTLNEAIDIFKTTAKADANFSYMQKFAEHLELVAHVPVRNIGTIAGNLMIKHNHHEFPSDVFLLLVSVGATLTIVDSNIFSHTVSMEKFLDHDMNKRVIKTISLPAFNSNYKFETYKIMPRAQNAHAIVNAVFIFNMNKETVKSATIVYGGISPKFIHATNAEKYLKGKKLFDNKVLQELFATLKKEINLDHVLPDPDPNFRQMLAISLIYKFILSISPKVAKEFTTGGQKLIRSLSEASQSYKESPDMYPIGKGIHKLEAYAQVSGKAEYIMDMVDERNQHWGAFVLAKFPVGTKIKTDATEAKKIPGVLDFIDYTDIKGRNSSVPLEPFKDPDPIFCEGTIQYFNQPVGLIVAESRELAEKAAKLVNVKSVKASTVKPVLTPQEAKDDSKRKKPAFEIKPKKTGKNVAKTITGSCSLKGQYHYSMETHVCQVVPKENDEYDVYHSTQSMEFTQMAASQCMNIPMNRINVIVRRLGGSFGVKISRGGLTSSAAFIAAVKLKKPIKIWMPFETSMDAIGKRHLWYADYEVKVDKEGIIQSLKLDAYVDIGLANIWEVPVYEFPHTFIGSYNDETFEVNGYTVSTDKPSTCFCRAPGTAEAQAMLETIMEHIACEMQMDPLELRLKNMKEEVKGIYQDTLKWAEYEKRKKEIDAFNKENRWRKKGIAILPNVFGLNFMAANYAMISIYSVDGTVAITHGGIEMGQGINTKAAQTVAYEFGIGMDKVFVKPANNVCSPNQFVTGASRTTEAICMALKGCCEKLKETIGMKSNKDDFFALVKEAGTKNIKLIDTHVFAPDEKQSQNYQIFGTSVTEIEYDVLTGNHIVRQVNIQEDMGYSMNPFIDVGQIEGAFVMAMGMWTMEDLIWDQDTGELKTTRTWNYKIPGMKDIPEKFYLKFPHEPNPISPFKSKATAEPPFCLGFSVASALKYAVMSAKTDAGVKPDKLWMPLDGPLTVEKNYMNSGIDTSQFEIS